jgi:hypothetical protein
MDASPFTPYLYLIIFHLPFVSYVTTNNKKKENNKTSEADAMLYTTFLKIPIKLVLFEKI